jgi:multiple sugar transport system substrate-binding protein
MKRLLFVLIIASFLLASCAQPAAIMAPVEITFLMWGAPEEQTVWQAVVDDFQKTNTNIKVNVGVSDWDSYWTKLNTLIAGKTPPDVFAMDAPLYLDWQSRGALLNLSQYIDKEKGFLDGFYPQTLEAYKLQDGYYGLPRDFQTIVLFYNKDMFDAAGVAYPTADWTYDDLKTAAAKLTKDTNGDGKIEQYGFWSDTWDMELLWSEAIWSYGGEIINPDKTKTLINEGSAHDAWVYIDSLYKDGVMPKPATAGEFGGDLFQSGAAAMTSIGHWAVQRVVSPALTAQDS